MDYAELANYGAKMRMENNKLVITLSNPPGLMISDIEKKNMDGNIYLIARRVSSGGGIREYTVNLSGHTLPADIKEHIFWVNPDATTTRLYPEYVK
jgi:hypothetical protein